MAWSNIKPKHGFRSGFESRVADELNADKITFEYETVKIPYEQPARKSAYNPDIIIRVKPDGTPKKKVLYVELKGRLLTSMRQKHLLIKSQHGDDYDIRFVFQNPSAKIGKKSKTTYAMWCDKHNFKYAKNHIPQEWLEED
jgi:hypothetical protein